MLPPFTDMRSVQTLVDGDRMKIGYGAQDVSKHDAGAYTGEISAAMLAKLGCTYVVAGHSERRQYHNEDDALVNAKAAKALAAGMIPIVCVGEGLEVRKAGEQVEYTLAQLDGSLAGLTPSRSPDSSSPTSRCGRSAPARWPLRRTRRRSARRSAAASGGARRRRRPTPYGFCTAGR